MNKIISGLFLLLINLAGIDSVWSCAINNQTVENALEIGAQDVLGSATQADNQASKSNFDVPDDDGSHSDICLGENDFKSLADDEFLHTNDSLSCVSGRYLDYWGGDVRIIFDSHEFDGCQVMVCAYPKINNRQDFPADGHGLHRQYFPIENGQAFFHLNYANLAPGQYWECYYLVADQHWKGMEKPEPVLIYRDSFISGSWQLLCL